MRNVLRFLAGALAGALLWWYAAPVYDGVVAAAAEPLLRLDKRFHDLDTAARDRWVLVRSAGGHFRLGELPVDQMTYNVILFLALLATLRKPRWGRLAIAVVSLFISHVVTFAIATESLYASARDPSSAEASGWMMATLFFRVVGMLAVAFGCWWFAGPARSMQTSGDHTGRRPRPRGRRAG
jgi:hypothetical protein